MREIGNGFVELNAPWWAFTPSFKLFGGPYDRCPPNYAGLCLNGNVNGSVLETSMEIEDFKLPKDPERVEEVLISMAELGTGFPLYFGCTAGLGRTGTMMALMCRAFGHTENPVEWLRENYTSHAVETPQQYQYVMDFDEGALRRVRWAYIVKVWRQRLGLK